MAEKLTYVKKGVLADRLHELYRVTANGTRDVDVVLAGLQGLIEGRSIEDHPMSSIVWPEWYSNPMMQISAVSDFLEHYGDGRKGFRPSDIPGLPDFMPRTPTEILLLSVMLPDEGGVSGFHRTFEAWWETIDGFSGKRRVAAVRSASDDLQLAPGIDYSPGIRWVVFDPSGYQSMSPDEALQRAAIDGVSLAHVEILMVAALFPAWATSWLGEGSPAPFMSGARIFHDGPSLGVPCIYLAADGGSLWLDAERADRFNPNWASPTVREC